MAFEQPECHICYARATITHEPYCSACGIPEHYEIDQLRKKVAELEARAEAAEQTVRTMSARIAELEAECGYDQRNAAMSQQESVAHLETIDTLNSRIVELEAKLHVYDAIAGDGDRLTGEMMRAKVKELERLYDKAVDAQHNLAVRGDKAEAKVKELEAAIKKTVDCDPIRPLNGACKDCGHILLCSALGTSEELSDAPTWPDRTACRKAGCVDVSICQIPPSHCEILHTTEQASTRKPGE